MKKHVFRRLVPYLRPTRAPFCWGAWQPFYRSGSPWPPPCWWAKGSTVCWAPAGGFSKPGSPFGPAGRSDPAGGGVSVGHERVHPARQRPGRPGPAAKAFDRINEVPSPPSTPRPTATFVSRLINDADAVSGGPAGAHPAAARGRPPLWVCWASCLAELGHCPAGGAGHPAVHLFAKFVAGRTHALFQRQAAAQGRLSGYVSEMVNGQPLVKAFGYEAPCTEQFEAINPGASPRKPVGGVLLGCGKPRHPGW